MKQQKKSPSRIEIASRKEKRRKLLYGFLSGILFGFLAGVYLGTRPLLELEDFGAAILILVFGGGTVFYLMHIRRSKDMFLDYAVATVALPSYELTSIVTMFVTSMLLRWL